jgi:hypothetical protein
MAVAEMKVAFSNLRETETYQGQDTGRFTLTGTLDDATAEMLSAQGVKIKEYENMAQRKFASKFPVKIIDANDNPFTGDIPRGSTVRISYKTGPAHPVHGTPTYLNAVRVLELAEDASGIDAEL